MSDVMDPLRFQAIFERARFNVKNACMTGERLTEGELNNLDEALTECFSRLSAWSEYSAMLEARQDTPAE